MERLRIWRFARICSRSVIFFNIHLSDLFDFLENLDIASYADDTTIYTIKQNNKSVMNALETATFQMVKHQLYES